MSGHTKGPWSFDPNSVTGSVWAGSEFVASVYPNAPTDADVFDEWPRLGEMRANARIVATAPELLSSLIALVEPDDDGRDRNWDGKFSERLSAARAAIAKATQP